jgi:hypothetical protein
MMQKNPKRNKANKIGKMNIASLLKRNTLGCQIGAPYGYV